MKQIPENKRAFYVKEDTKLPSVNNDDFYYTNEITKNAVGFLNNQNAEKKPFFLYLAYTSPHWPLQALPEDIKKYEGKYDIGWDSLRTLRFARQKELGIINKDQKISVKSSNLPAWKNLTYEEQKLWAKRMEVYAAQVDNLDQNIGRVVQQLKDLNKLDNTIIFLYLTMGQLVKMLPADLLINQRGIGYRRVL